MKFKLIACPTCRNLVSENLLNRHYRSQHKAWIHKETINKTDQDEILIAGQLMSNVFFNWAQQDRFPPAERQMMNDLWKRWDAAQLSARGDVDAKENKAPS